MKEPKNTDLFILLHLPASLCKKRHTSGDAGKGPKKISHEMRVREKEEEEWKIHIASMHLFIPRTQYNIFR
jgi:hypothetical protein